VDDEDYQVPFKFTCKLNKLTLDRPEASRPKTRNCCLADQAQDVADCDAKVRKLCRQLTNHGFPFLRAAHKFAASIDDRKTVLHKAFNSSKKTDRVFANWRTRGCFFDQEGRGIERAASRLFLSAIGDQTGGTYVTE
jgi:hypothetical protein